MKDNQVYPQWPTSHQSRKPHFWLEYSSVVKWGNEWAVSTIRKDRKKSKAFIILKKFLHYNVGEVLLRLITTKLINFVNVCKLIVTKDSAYQESATLVCMHSNSPKPVTSFTMNQPFIQRAGDGVTKKPTFSTARVHLENHLLTFQNMFGCLDRDRNVNIACLLPL
jgi:hypothetical protein